MPETFPFPESDIDVDVGPGRVRLRKLLGKVGEGVIVWGLDGRLLYANRAAKRLFALRRLCRGESYARLGERWVAEKDAPLAPEDLPVAQVLNRHVPCEAVLLGVKTVHTRWLSVSAYPVFDRNGRMLAVLNTAHAVTHLVEKCNALERHAYYDVLTGLANRSLLSDRMAVAMAMARRSGESLAVCMMDLDGFKSVNDSLGHKAGDQLLKATAQRLLSTLREVDTAVRLGGDEFVLLIGGIRNEQDAEAAVHRLLHVIDRPFAIQDVKVHVTASIGVTLFPQDNAVPDLLLRHADQAMYQAKDAGKNTFHLFDPTLASRLRANRNTLDRIRQALDKGQFELYYQPQVDCRQGRVVGVEALLRWNHPILGVRSPGEFLPLIENEDLIVRLGDWVIQNAAAQMAVWRRRGLDLAVGVNIAARHLLSPAFSERLDTVLRDRERLGGANLEIEILESAALEDIKAVAGMVNRFRPEGVGFALDDFGTGFSSLAHLKYMSVNTLKIDRTFVRDMLNDPGDLAIVQGILGLAEAFHCRVIAEGVEGVDQVLLLLQLGCSVMQGYAVARPMPAARVTDWIERFEQNPLWRIAGEAWPSRQDFELLTLEVSHRHWVNQVIRHEPGLSKPSPLGDPVGLAECPITRWRKRQPPATEAGAAELLHQLDHMHRQLHADAERLNAAKKARDKDAVQSLMNQLEHSSTVMLERLRKLRDRRYDQVFSAEAQGEK